MENILSTGVIGTLLSRGQEVVGGIVYNMGNQNRNSEVKRLAPLTPDGRQAVLEFSEKSEPLNPHSRRHLKLVDLHPSVHVLSESEVDDAILNELIEQGQSVIATGDASHVLNFIPDKVFQTCVTSPPYWSLRDYNISGQIGLEDTVDAYIAELVTVFREVRRTLKDDGTLWLNIGDSYTSGGRTWRAIDKKNPVRAMDRRPPTPDGLKRKDLIGIPWKLAFALQADGWYLRTDIIWNKPNCQPESVKDRPTRGHEYIFLLSKSEQYFYNNGAVRGPNNRNIRTVWDINTQPYSEAHFATFPTALIEPCLALGSSLDTFALDPFFGSGTTGQVALSMGRKFVGIELNPEYVRIARRRLKGAIIEK